MAQHSRREKQKCRTEGIGAGDLPFAGDKKRAASDGGRSLFKLWRAVRLTARRANQFGVNNLAIVACLAPVAKIFRFEFLPNHLYIRRRPFPLEGRCATSSTRDGMRWTQGSAQDE